MARTKAARWLLAGWLAVIPSHALAVDPVLHEDIWFRVPITSTLPPAIEPDESIAGVEVEDIQDLGPKPGGADPPGDLWQRIRAGFAMAELRSPLVTEREAWYAQRPDQMRLFVDRSRRYLFHIVEEIERRGMPTELALLPMVESAYNPMAYSRAHASGLWQFIPSTGRNYNLGQNWWYDARRDILASTSAALDYLQQLREMFGDWHLALAAYNMGENGVQRAIDRNRAKGQAANYQSLRMPNETRRYVPTLQALKNIFADPGAFGLELDPIPNAPVFVTVTLTRDIDLRVAAKLAEMPVEELVALNPGHNRPVAAAAHAPQLVLPTDRAEAFIRNLESHELPLSSWQTYTFKAGDRLEKLAAEHRVSVERLRAINGLGPKATVVVGQQLLLPQKGTEAASEPLPPVFTSPARVAAYVVKKGDTWAGIANAFGVRIADLRRWNDGAQLAVGETLVIQSTPKLTRKRSARPTAKSAPARPAASAQAARPSASF
jgi:membrane-bound lytic murein transglycosylase D